MTRYSDDNILWTSFKEGDEAAYHQLYESYVPLLFNYGCKFSADRQFVKDCLQDLFARLWERKENLATPPSVRNYLYKAFRNTLLKKQKKEEKYSYQGDLHAFHFEIAVPPDAGIIQKEMLEAHRSVLEGSVNKLTRRQREVIYLKFYEELSYAEIAELLDVQVKAVYHTMSRALGAMRQDIKDPDISLLLVLLLATSLMTVVSN